MSATSGLIDIHHHAIPPAYAAALRGRVAIPGVDYPSWSPEESLAVMDRHGIEAAVLSITAPGVTFLEGPDARRMAREVNEYFAGLIRAHPTRFGGFAVLPLPDVAAAEEELAYALDVLELDGVGLLTSYGNRYLGDPAFESLLAGITERGVAVHVHPMTPPARDLETFDLPPSLYEFTFETTRTVMSLLFNGVLDRLPRLRLITSHAGGTLPFLAQRLTYGPTIGAHLKDRAPADLIGSLGRLHYDIAMSATEFALPALTRLAGTDHILFGSDFPFMPAAHTTENTEGFRAHAGWSEEERAAIGRTNALRLLPALAQRLAAA
ncbi:amidohydrolase family protein [Streptomyces alkaliphilus]|uniref:Amidohydrolase family protein n=1 Tax=Streptomyces alkaliphilus TaxID=1472722 RepID=A0A7W3TA89_9ACTN|nr:amidohydrolase family protein [Streptomyces alkaliphilus]MBB0243082.1 amidohydrolase family protein [Streptomyces alkaliphilus]